MGAYLNPGFAYFEACTKGFFIDKTELISFIDRKLGTKESLMLVSRPRRFGKTLAARMLSAYYGSGYDSRRLFENRRIAKLDPSLTGINSYHVLFLDVSSFWTQVKTWQSKENEESREANRTPRQLDWIWELVKDMEADLIKSFGESVKGRDLYETLENIVEVTGKKFLWICDEWDMFFREACPDPHVQRNYLEFLRRLFKSGDYTLKVFIGAYMTGILPMKKIKGQSAISDFSEYSMLLPRDLSSFYGFTQDEVKIICKKENLPLAETEKWYDGYQIGPMTSIYNPKSIAELVANRIFTSYWSKSASYASLEDYIKLNIPGTRDIVIDLLRGIPVKISDPEIFQNDLFNMKQPNEILTALVHLGYLTYDYYTGNVRIPNLEVRREFFNSLSDDSWADTLEKIHEADSLLEATWQGEEEKVATSLEKLHAERGDSLKYNSEARLSEAVQMAYYTAGNYYVRIFELASGTGYVDIAFIPRPGKAVPPMIVELKWDKPANAAIQQIKERGYIDKIKAFAYHGEVLLVGITYNSKSRGKDAKKHRCIIEKMTVTISS